MSNVICRHCPCMKMLGRARETGNNYGLKGPRGYCWCKHPKAVESFYKVLPNSHRSPAFIDFTPPGEVYPALQTAPRWCPLRQEAHHEKD